MQTYQGTLLFVSHDQDFVNKLATDIIELSQDGAREYQGNYELYVYQKQQEAQKEDSLRVSKQKYVGKTDMKKKEEHKNSPKTSSAQTKALERTIEKLEREIARTEHSFAQLTFGTQAFDDAQRKLAALRKELDIAMREWEASQR